ncbi:hypothetical protein BASA83_001746 [Batrachochytrium salamandrivorans]|nr:hypothetical protein BASA81_016600 [Batrachochytrium salamandrivorans]KAH9275940.1 hypothetical protein BASA83_001746 [Batrachochytrium salamandrivorans]
MNSKYRKELMSLHDALDISLQFVLSNAEKVMLQSDTELRSFYVLLPEASLPSPATPREPLKWQDFWPMEYVERLWDQDSEYDSDHDLPPQDYEVRGDNFAWWRFMTEFGAFQGMRTVRRKVSRGWELAQADAKLADAAEGEKVRLKMQQHRDLHFRHYHSRLGGGREIGDALCEEFVDLFELEEVQSDDGDITGVNRDGSDHATQGLLTSDGGAAHPRYPQHSGVLSTQGLSSDENSKKTRNINCDSEHDSDLALKDLPQTLSGRAQYSQLTDNPDHNNHSSPAFTESPRDSRTGRHLSVSGIAGSLLSSTTSWLMNPGKPTEKRFIQEDKDSGDWSVTPKLGWFDNEEKEQRPRSGDLLSLRPRESMLGLRWSSTDSSQKPSDKQENTLPLGETELGALPPNSTTTHDGLVGNANALPMSTNASVGRSWLTSIRTAMTTSTTTVSNSGSVPPVSNSHISEKLPLHVSNSTAKVSTTEDSVQFADSSPMNCIDSVHYQTTPPATPNHSSAHISATAAELKHQNLSRVPMIDSPPLGLRSQRRIILEEPE